MLAMNGNELKLLGGTMDLHAGQLVDRIGVLMSLPFPAGPHLEKLALQGQAQAILPVSMAERDLKCHFSGAETKLAKLLQQECITAENAAMEVYDVLARTIARMLVAGKKETGYGQALVAGGVASSPLFRKLLCQRAAKLNRELRIHFGI